MPKKCLFPLLILLFYGCSKDDSNSDRESTTISSSSFEQALIDMGIDLDGKLNGKIATTDIAAISFLALSNHNISDLSGLEKFTGLKKLECFNNQLTRLDVSQNRELKELDFSNNLITNIDVSQNTALTSLVCYDNQLTSLDVSQNVALATLACTNNQLSSIDLQLNTNLTQVYCSENQLTSLDVSQNQLLIELFCRENQLTSLNLNQNSALAELYCNDNQLASLDIKNGNNTILMEFNATGNTNLTCISIDNEILANEGDAPYNVWFKDNSALYAENCDDM